ncbi:MAG: hypothetical protein GY703_09340 [Gammaproteobacteria bacterium]|nr:hypothetical protein [Gammaproteobacteria bacterium]
MKLIQKLTLGFLSVALLLALAGYIQTTFIRNIEHDVNEVGHSNIGELKNSIGIAYQISIVNADMAEYLLKSIAGQTGRKNEREQQIRSDLESLNESIQKLQESTEMGLTLAEDEDSEAGEEEELESIALLEG